MTIVIVVHVRAETKASEKPIQRTDIKWKALSKSNYKIQYPDNWELNESGVMGTSFIIFSPVESDSDTYRENVTLIIQDISGQNIDLSKFVDISLSQFHTLLTNPQLFENKRVKVATKEYQKMVYSFDQGALHLKTEQYLFVIKNKAYVLTLSTTPGTFEKYKKTGEAILASFLVK